MLLSTCMIVRDEERFLPGCLRALEGLSDELVVVDTGSVDRTVAIAREHGARLFEHAWTGDYAEARNVGLKHARGDFILYIDADEEVAEADREPLRTALLSGRHDAVIVNIVSPLFGSDKTNVVRYARLFRNYPDLEFKYAIHEQIWPSLSRHNPRLFDSDFSILHHGYNQSEAIMQGKRQRNLDIALEVLKREPDNGFYLYQAGVGYLLVGQVDSGVRFLERSLRFIDRHNRPSVLNALAQAHYDSGAHDETERWLAQSTAACPQQIHGWALLADLYLLGNRHGKAIDALQQCLDVTTSQLNNDVSPPRSVLLLKLGLSQLLTRSAHAAKRSLHEAIALGLTAEQQATAERYLGLADKMGA